MNEEEKNEILGVIEDDGFDYAFRYYSNFKRIEDAEFHRLRLAYIEAAKNLENYLGIKE